MKPSNHKNQSLADTFIEISATEKTATKMEAIIYSTQVPSNK